jgi:type I restriction enzyme, S subunit
MSNDELPFQHPWDEGLIKDYASVIVGGTPRTEIEEFWGGDIPWMASGEVHLRHIYDVPGRITARGLRGSNAVIVQPKAVAIALAGQGKTRGTVALTHVPICTNQSVAMIKPIDDKLDAEFLYQSLIPRYEELRSRSAGGGRAGLSKGILEQMPIQVPPFPVQQRITKVLSTIDRTITHTEALIEKYQQIKAGLMHDLFTRGIGADGKLRPPRDQAPEMYRESSIGWIPKEWDCVALSQVADLVVGFAFKSDWFQDNGISLLRGENVGYGHPDWKDKRCLSYDKAGHYKDFLLGEGDVVIGMDRTFTKSGVKITVLRDFDCPCLLVQRVGKFVAMNCYDLYLRWILLSSKYLRDLVNQQKGMDIPHLSRSEILAPFIPLPPVEEQVKIAKRIEVCNSTIQKEYEHLEKLQKQKSGLMHDLLTGKVQVNIDFAEAVND